MVKSRQYNEQDQNVYSSDAYFFSTRIGRMLMKIAIQINYLITNHDGQHSSYPTQTQSTTLSQCNSGFGANKRFFNHSHCLFY